MASLVIWLVERTLAAAEAVVVASEVEAVAVAAIGKGEEEADAAGQDIARDRRPSGL